MLCCLQVFRDQGAVPPDPHHPDQRPGGARGRDGTRDSGKVCVRVSEVCMHV